MVALFLCLLGCCVLFVHFIIPTIPKKTVRFSRCPFGVISFPCVVDVCYLFPKTKNTVRGLWVPSVDAIVDRRNWGFLIFFVSAMCGWSICYVFRVHFLGVAPRCRFFRVCKNWWSALYWSVAIVCWVSYSLVLWVDPFGCMVVWWILIGFESGCLLISCRLMVSLAVCIHTLQKRKDLGEFRFWMKVCLWVIM